MIDLLSRASDASSLRLIGKLFEKVFNHKCDRVCRLLNQETLYNLNEEAIDIFRVEVLLQLSLDISNLYMHINKSK